jgi:hypothetical protein
MEKLSKHFYSREKLRYFREEVVKPLIKRASELAGKNASGKITSQAGLAVAIGLDHAELSRRLNGTGRTALSKDNVLQIVIEFIRQEAITSLEVANTILAEMDVATALTFTVLKEQYAISSPNSIFYSSDSDGPRKLEKSSAALVEYSEYAKAIREEYENGSYANKWRVPPLAKVYVPLQGSERQYKLKEGQAAISLEDVSAYSDVTVGTGKDVLQERIIEWLATQSTEADNSLVDGLVVVFGSYGIGKSSFCQHLTFTLLHQNHRRKPILISLATLGDSLKKDSKQSSFDNFIIEYLKKAGWENVTVAQLEQEARAGKLFFIFDGFDEMTNRERDDYKVIRDNFKLLQKWAVPGNKVLVTTRPEYFFDNQEIFSLTRFCRRFYGHLLDSEQIEAFLKKRVGWENQHNQLPGQQYAWEEYRDFIDRTYHLYDLQHRFVLLEMIVQLLPAYMEQNRFTVTRSDLYRDFIHYELTKRKDQETFPVLKAFSISQRQGLMEELAYQLYCSRNQTNANELGFETKEAWKLLEPYLQENDLRLELLENLNNFLMYSLLNRVGNDYFEFSHKSFFEYLVATRLDQQLRKGDLSGLKVRHLSREIADFLAEFEPPTEFLVQEAAGFRGGESLTYGAGQLLLALRLYKLNQKLLDQAGKKKARSEGNYGIKSPKVENKPVCDSSYITCLEYYVFLSEREQSGYIHHPDHWSYSDFGARLRATPITGLIDLDAAAFCEWLNTRREESLRTYTSIDQEQVSPAEGEVQYRYRLPVVGEDAPEIRALLLERPELRPWTASYPFFRLLGPAVEGVAAYLDLARDKGELPRATLTWEFLALAPAYVFDHAGIVSQLADNSVNLVLSIAFAKALESASEGEVQKFPDQQVHVNDLPLALTLACKHTVTRQAAKAAALEIAAGMRAVAPGIEAKLKEEKFEEALQELDEHKQAILTVAGQASQVQTQLAVNFLEQLIKHTRAEEIPVWRESYLKVVAFYGKIYYNMFIESNIKFNQEAALFRQAMANGYWREVVAKARQADPSFPVWETLLIVLDASK